MPIWLVKIIGKRIIKAIKHRIDLKKIDDYVNKPNKLDKEIKLLKKENAQMRKNMNKNSKYTEELEKEVAILRKDSHPRSDWICLECGCKAKKVEKATKRKRKKRR